MNLKITKKDWIFLSFVRTRLQKRRARQANAPERLHHHHQQHHQQQQRSASFSRRAHKSARFFSAVARVFSSSSSIGCVSLARVFFSFKLLLEKGLVFSCGVPEGPALGARRTKSRYPARALSQSYDFGARGGGNVRTV